MNLRVVSSSDDRALAVLPPPLARSLELPETHALADSARDDAVGFYARLGYVTFGGPYVEVGVPHQNMRRSLRSAPGLAGR